MIVTTAGKFDDKLIEKAEKINRMVHGRLVSRKNQSISSLHTQFNDHILMVGKEKLTLHPLGQSEPLFFHPNSSMFRVKQILRGETDPLLSAARLEKGMTMLDCTAGLASDAIVCSLAVGNSGKVVGIEKNRYIAFLVESGLVTWDSGIKEMDDAMRRIAILNEDHFSYLKTLPDDSFDVVYFDPMFEESIDSPGLKGLKGMAAYVPITEETINEAERVARRRVVLKDHFKSTRFSQFGFTVIKRPSSKFHYAVIELTN
ncbi:class I SAM-dependent methyltransferase [Fictibacillus sp. FJAT-27399]|uniref:class I SAM-dependent methyltransferase n=1 Tax=Fictibacillus sp. FJAT-27399 TaxID=1729689 RepID=UPI0007801E83|nr:class I SAM-dependent methyltransferase [Fictibacillus sp. FJAT-27399]